MGLQGVEVHPQKFWFVEIQIKPWKSGQNGTWLQKMVPNVCRKTHQSCFWRSHQKGFFMGEKLLAKVTQNFSGKFGGLWGKILRTPKNLPAPSLMSRGWPKIFLQRGPKVAKFHFHHSKLRKQLFLQKSWWENVKFQNPWGPCSPPWAREADLFGLLFDVFTNKHIMNFENNSHWYLFLV